MRLRVASPDLLRFASRMETRAANKKAAIVSALNQVGDGVRREVVQQIMAETGVGRIVASSFVTVSPATHRRTVYDISIRPIDGENTRTIPGRTWRSRPDTDFKQGELVKVVTAKDDKVCPICEDIALEGPYTRAEIENIKIRHPHFLNRGFNCRCAVEPFRYSRRLQVTSVVPGQTTRMAHRLSIKDLAKKARGRLALTLKATR